MAESVGVSSFFATTEDEVARAVAEAVTADGPSLIEARVDGSVYGEMLRAVRG
jgi:thiamine pyrophosphate-dependent acetolactate synthase large subunit-like protein